MENIFCMILTNNDTAMFDEVTETRQMNELRIYFFREVIIHR